MFSLFPARLARRTEQNNVFDNYGSLKYDQSFTEYKLSLNGTVHSHGHLLFHFAFTLCITDDSVVWIFLAL